MSTFLDEFAGSQTGGTLSMSLNALAFPDEFEIPFEDGQGVKPQCFTPQLNPEGQVVRDAFNNLSQVWP